MTATTPVRLRTSPTADLSPAELDRIRALLDSAFGDHRFDDDDWSHAQGGVHVLATVDGELVAHAALLVRHLSAGELSLRTGYVEAVATAVAWRCQGIASMVMAAVERLIVGGFELGALSASQQGIVFYAARHWERWTGPTAGHTATGVVDCPDEAVFVLRTPATPAPLDTAVRLVCDWRRGDLW
jgi:aminoglycoside 2'-N-acetyltransferase I